MIRFDRLRDAITALRESPAPERFAMLFTEHPCGTPACVWGHYRARFAERNPSGKQAYWLYRAVTLMEHFGLTNSQVLELFNTNGCGNAQTPAQAIAYIEAFILRHGGTLDEPKAKPTFAEWIKPVLEMEAA